MFRCIHCRENFVDVKEFSKHMQVAHPPNYGYNCGAPLCVRKYSSFESLRKHMRVKHSRNVPSNCERLQHKKVDEARDNTLNNDKPGHDINESVEGVVNDPVMISSNESMRNDTLCDSQTDVTNDNSNAKINVSTKSSTMFQFTFRLLQKSIAIQMYPVQEPSLLLAIVMTWSPIISKR